MNTCLERMWICIGWVVLGWSLVAIGFHWALWAVRTSRINLDQIKKHLKG